MPEARERLDALQDTELTLSSGSHKAAVLTLLARDPDMGYEPREIAAETPVPKSSVYKVLQRLREDGLIEKLSDHYLVNPERVDDIEEMLLTTRQFDAVGSVSDRNTAPEEVVASSPEELDSPDDDLLSE